MDFESFPFHEEERGNRGVIIIVVSIFELFFSPALCVSLVNESSCLRSC